MAKRYLDVSYDDRELAKRLGAKWDPSVRRWYCPVSSPLAKIFKWRAEARLLDVQAKAANPGDGPNNASAGKPQDSHINQDSHMNSDIHFKTLNTAPPPPNRTPQPAINQNFELFMAS